jgi:hypothetical protein
LASIFDSTIYRCLLVLQYQVSLSGSIIWR